MERPSSKLAEGLNMTDDQGYFGEVGEIGIDEIIIPDIKWRRKMDRENILALAVSIEEFGLLQPILVRETDAGYELLAGEHRLEAAKENGLEFITANIVDVDDQDAALVSLEENLRRFQPDEVEWADGLARWRALHNKKYGIPQRGGDRGNQYTGGKESGKNPRRVFAKVAANALETSETEINRAIARSEKLAPKAREAWEDKEIKASQVDELVKLPKEKQEDILSKVTGKTVKETKAIVREFGKGSGVAKKKVAGKVAEHLERISQLLEDAVPIAVDLNTFLVEALAIANGHEVKGLVLGSELSSLLVTLTDLDAAFGGDFL